MSKDEFFKDRYETPDRETVLEAENKRLKEMTQWEYAKNLLIKNDRLNVENAALKARIEELEKKCSGGFVQGYVCAIATYIKMNDNDTNALELLSAGCATLKEAKVAGVDDYDIEACKPTWKEIAYRHKA